MRFKAQWLYWILLGALFFCWFGRGWRVFVGCFWMCNVRELGCVVLWLDERRVGVGVLF